MLTIFGESPSKNYLSCKIKINIINNILFHLSIRLFLSIKFLLKTIDFRVMKEKSEFYGDLLEHICFLLSKAWLEALQNLINMEFIIKASALRGLKK